MTSGSESLRVFLLDTETSTRNTYISLSIKDALARNPEIECVLLGTLDCAIAQFRSSHCNVFIAFGSAASQAPILSRLCSLASHSILWTTEDPYDLNANVMHSVWFDSVYTNDRSSSKAYNGRAAHLPLAGSKLFQDLPVITDDSKYRYDLTFVGTAWPNRVEDLERIVDSLPRKTLFKIGLSGNAHLPLKTLNSNIYWTDWRTSNPNFARLANLSRVTLGLERRFTASERGDMASGESPPPRLFEVALAGGYQVFRTDSTEIGCYYENDKDLAYRKSIPETIDEIRWAFDNPYLRIDRAIAAREKTLANHTYDARVARILSDLKDRGATELKPIPFEIKRKHPCRVLVVTHNILGERAGGGVEIYQSLLKLLGPNYRVYFLYPSLSESTATFMVLHPNGETLRFELPYKFHTNVNHDAAAEQIFAKLLFDLSIDLVHYQHLLHFPLSLPLISKACGVPSIFTAHDHYLICKRFNLIDYRGVFCDAANISVTTCDACLDASEALPHGSQIRRRNFIRTVLQAVDIVVTNTEGSLDFLRRIYSDLALEKCRVIEMCLPIIQIPIRERGDRKPHNSLRVAIPGNFTKEKGADQVVRLMNLLRDDPIHFSIFGVLPDEFQRILSALALKKYAVIGGYRSDDALDLLDGHDVSLHLSIWPETYVITLSEAWAVGIIPIVSNLGALGERVTDGFDGFVVNPFDIGRVVDILRSLSTDENVKARIQNVVTKKSIKTAFAHLSELDTLYMDLIKQNSIVHVDHDRRRYSGLNIDTVRLGIRTNSPRWDTSDNEWDESINNTVKAAEIPQIQQATDVFGDIPSQYRHLPVFNVDEQHDGARCYIDFVAVDDVRADAEIATTFVGENHFLRVRGWAHKPNMGRVLERFVSVHSGGSQRIYWATPMDRTDVASTLGDDVALGSGFDILIPTSGLEVGHYWIDVIILYDGSILRFRRRSRLDIRPRSETEAVNQDKRLDGKRAVLSILDFPLKLPKISLLSSEADVAVCLDSFEANQLSDEITSDNLVDTECNTYLIKFEGWTFHKYSSVPLEIFCCISGEGKPFYFSGHCIRRPDLIAKFHDPLVAEAGFLFEIRVPSLGRGVYKVDLFQIYRDSVIEITNIKNFEVGSISSSDNMAIGR